MDKILYLTHFTRVENAINIIKSDYLFTNIERMKKNIKYEGVLSQTLNKYNNNDFTDEFPGIYMSYITESDINKLIYEQPVLQISKRIMFVFSKKLLEQKNYHCNIIDHNGHISENLTYFSFNLDKIPNQSDVIKFYETIYGNYPGNEIIFHDKISLSALCEIWAFNKETYNELLSKIPSKYNNLIKIKKKYPKTVKCPANIEIDTKSLPFLIDLDFKYSGLHKVIYPYKTKTKSSKSHFIKIAKIAGISDNDINKYDLSNPQKLNDYLVKHKLYTYFHENRDKQHFTN
jgi:hypothetical protein